MVTDASGAAVKGAEIKIISQDTHVKRTSFTGDNEVYLVLQQPPGNYEIVVKQQGFATEGRSHISLEVNQSITVNFRLKVSAADETLTVSGAAPLPNITSTHAQHGD